MIRNRTHNLWWTGQHSNQLNHTSQGESLFLGPLRPACSTSPPLHSASFCPKGQGSDASSSLCALSVRVFSPPGSECSLHNSSQIHFPGLSGRPARTHFWPLTDFPCWTPSSMLSTGCLLLSSFCSPRSMCFLPSLSPQTSHPFIQIPTPSPIPSIFPGHGSFKVNREFYFIFKTQNQLII